MPCLSLGYVMMLEKNSPPMSIMIFHGKKTGVL